MKAEIENMKPEQRVVIRKLQAMLEEFNKGLAELKEFNVTCVVRLEFANVHTSYSILGTDSTADAVLMAAMAEEGADSVLSRAFQTDISVSSQALPEREMDGKRFDFGIHPDFEAPFYRKDEEG